MANSPSQEDASRSAQRKTPDEDPLAELRNLILNPEQQQLASLRQDLEYLEKHPSELTPEELSDVLPEAIVHRSNQDKQLSKALAPTVEEAIQASVRKNPQPLVDAIFPVIGPAIRKAITSALNSTIQSLNQTLEHSFSIQGLKWRIEAIRSGRSFAEVVLSHTLLYRVEQAFLIHRETGILLQHVATGMATVQDADMVSGMLTAIQDFVHDSFDVGKGEQLDTMQVGELTVWIERGPYAVLAAVIRGTPRQEFRSVLLDAVETIHLELDPAFQSFTGDTAIFAPGRPHLEACLQAQFTEEEEKKKTVSPVFIVIMSALVIGLGIWVFFTVRDYWRWSEYLERLNAQPGIVVTDTGTRDGRFYVEGLRDPLATDPQQLLGGAGLTKDEVVAVWEPYQAFLPQFTVQRATRLLRPPSTVSLRVENGILYVSGMASQQWLRETRDLIRFMPAVTGLNENDLLTAETVRVLDLKNLIENLTIEFPLGSAQIGPDGTRQFRTVAETLRRLTQAAADIDRRFQIEIVGHTDSTGTDTINRMVSRRRATKVLEALLAAGFDASDFIIQGIGATEPVSDRTQDLVQRASRRVTFRVVLADSLIGEDMKP